MLSIIPIVTGLFSKVFTYPEVGQIRNWEKHCSHRGRIYRPEKVIFTKAEVNIIFEDC